MQRKVSSVNRRQFLLGSGGLAVASVSASSFPVVAKPVSKSSLMPSPKGNRVVIVGGGWGGITAAKYVKKDNPNAEVILIEKNHMFISCPMSNHFLFGLLDYESLCYPYNTLRVKHDVKVINDRVLDIDLRSKKVVLPEGFIEWDYLILSLGIEYDIDDKPFYKDSLEFFPPGFTPGSEHLYLKRFIEEFEGKDIVLTVPKMPYRCPPAPYERAAMLLSYIRSEGLKAHLYFIDANPNPPVLKDGFLEAYKDFYKSEADYLTSTQVKDIDVAKKVVKTDKGDIKFDFASIIPPMRAPKLLERIGLLKRGQKWVKVNPLTFESEVKNVFVIGDSASTYLPKSGYAAHSEAKVVAKIVAGRIANRKIKGRIIQHGICYAMVNLKAAMMLEIEFIYDANLKKVKPVKREDNTWKVSTAKRYYEWAKGVWRDMFN